MSCPLDYQKEDQKEEHRQIRWEWLAMRDYYLLLRLVAVSRY
jgi:hypothetical protein